MRVWSLIGKKNPLIKKKCRIGSCFGEKNRLRVNLENNISRIGKRSIEIITMMIKKIRSKNIVEKCGSWKGNEMKTLKRWIEKRCYGDDEEEEEEKEYLKERNWDEKQEDIPNSERPPHFAELCYADTTLACNFFLLLILLLPNFMIIVNHYFMSFIYLFLKEIVL